MKHHLSLFVSTQSISLSDNVLMIMRQTIRCWLFDWKTFFLNKLAIRIAFWLKIGTTFRLISKSAFSGAVCWMKNEVACLRAAFWMIEVRATCLIGVGAACLIGVGAACWIGVRATFWLGTRATFWLMNGVAWLGACSSECGVACSEECRACWLDWLTEVASGGCDDWSSGWWTYGDWSWTWWVYNDWLTEALAN